MNRACAVLAAGCAISACTDPRERPLAPTVQLQFAPSLEVHSPDTLEGALFLFDSDGLHSVRLRAYTANGALSVDSLIPLGDFEHTVPIAIPVPSGLPVGTAITLAVRAEDFAGFQTSDSTVFTTQP